MDRTLEYRTIIQRLLCKIESWSQGDGKELETILVFDETRDHYFLYAVGWQNKKRVSGSTIFLRIRNGKVWIEDDWTDMDIAGELLEAGVPKEDIVLAFQPPSLRPYTEFATA